MTTLDGWAAAVSGRLGLDPAAVDTGLVLDLARDVAHAVMRPAAPLTAYLVGVAVGMGRDQVEAVRIVTAMAAELADAAQPPTA